MIYIRCGVALPGALVIAFEAFEALERIKEIREANVEILSISNDAGDPLTTLTLKLMAADPAIFIEGLFPIAASQPLIG